MKKIASMIFYIADRSNDFILTLLIKRIINNGLGLYSLLYSEIVDPVLFKDKLRITI